MILKKQYIVGGISGFIIVLSLSVIVLAFQNNSLDTSTKSLASTTNTITEENINNDGQVEDSSTVSAIPTDTNISPTTKSKFSPTNTIKPITKPTTIINKTMIANLDKSSSSILQKLFEYQYVTNSFVTDKIMIFTNMPTDASANELAQDLSVELKEFAKYKITPIVIVEPTNVDGILDVSKYLNGNYDNAANNYVNKLKSLGITSEMMGIWTPFPEINIPEWNGTNYTNSQYSQSVNKYLKHIRSNFPSVKTSLLLDSVTLDNWANENYLTDHTSLVPYVKDIEKGLVDYFCLQGFAWIAPKGSNETSSLDPSTFLSINQAKEAADALGIKNIWFNTGTPVSMFTNDASQTSYLPSDKRKEILTQIVNQSSDLKNKGYNVFIHIFAEDKSKANEAVDWSYWKDYKSTTDVNISVFKEFFNLAVQKNLTIALYDNK